MWWWRSWLESTWWSSRPRGFGQEVWAIVMVLLSFMKLGTSLVDCCCNHRRRSEWARMPIGVDDTTPDSCPTGTGQDPRSLLRLDAFMWLSSDCLLLASEEFSGGLEWRGGVVERNRLVTAARLSQGREADRGRQGWQHLRSVIFFFPFVLVFSFRLTSFYLSKFDDFWMSERSQSSGGGGPASAESLYALVTYVHNQYVASLCLYSVVCRLKRLPSESTYCAPPLHLLPP
jgi:hypothetical protein